MSSKTAHERQAHPEQAVFECRICHSGCGPAFCCRERMFGTGEEFAYAECGGCGTLQLIEVPSDLSPYYPSNYYSYAEPPGRDGAAERLVKATRAVVLLRSPDFLYRRMPAAARPVWADWFRGTLRALGDPIVDIGSGAGSLAFYLRNNGFSRVIAFDPFLPDDEPRGYVPVYRSFPPRFNGTVKVAMLHHSLEHVVDPKEALSTAAEMLAADGAIVVRVPLADSFAWRHYREDWIALDPPRHIHLFTERGLGHLAGECGLRVVRRWRDSGSMQFWGSEQFKLGIVLEDPRSLYRCAESDLFSVAEIADFERRTAELNADDDGDAGCFILQRI